MIGAKKERMTFMVTVVYARLDLKCDNGGKVQLLKHCSNQKHQGAMRRTKDTKQTKLIFSSKAEATPSSSRQGNLGSLTITADGALEVEIFWLAKMACNNFSLRSSDHIGDLFQAMFPDSKVAKAFSMSRTKACYTVGDGLGPHFAQTIVDDLTKSELPFSVLFDETTTSQVKKQMDILLRYWSPKHEEVWTVYYTSLFFGHAEGELVAIRMYKKMLEDGIPVQRLATLVRDGPNVNKIVFHKMDKFIREDYSEFPGLVDLGTYSLHTVHNAFNKGMDQYGKEVDQLCLNLHALFKYSPARHEDFKSIQDEMDSQAHNFLKHTEVRWSWHLLWVAKGED